MNKTQIKSSYNKQLPLDKKIIARVNRIPKQYMKLCMFSFVIFVLLFRCEFLLLALNWLLVAIISGVLGYYVSQDPKAKFCVKISSFLSKNKKKKMETFLATPFI